MDSSLTRKWRSLPSVAQDAAMAVGLTLIGMLSGWMRPGFIIRGGGFGGGSRAGSPEPRIDTHAPHGFSPDPLSYVLVAAAFLPLTLRRRYPLPVLAVVTAVAALNDLRPGPPSLVFLAPLIALYTVGTLYDRRTLVIAAVLTAAVQLAVSLPAFSEVTFWADAVRIVAIVGVAAAIGDATRNRRAYVAEVEERAAEAERTREEEARRRVDEERLRIARELHDVTAHSLSIIAVQSGVAAHVIDSNPFEARRALEAIRRTSKDALDELRAMLGVLRSGDEPDAPLAPTPGLARLGELVEPMREAGIDVTLMVDSDLAEIPAMVDASAYRIVQEALTNVVRHAGPCSVTVVVRRDEDLLVIDVTDTGRGPGPGGEVVVGHGLAGMSERASALGGSFDAAPSEVGGFQIIARLPLSSRGGRVS